MLSRRATAETAIGTSTLARCSPTSCKSCTPLAELLDDRDELRRQSEDTLIAAELVDEYRMFVFPVVVGHGARLFESVQLRLRLLETRTFRSGANLLRYAATK